MTIEVFIMWLKVLVYVLPLLPHLIQDVEDSVQHFQNDPTAAGKIGDAQKALDSVGTALQTILSKL